ncbi:MAG TPA: DUF5329 family protein [Thermoanaerobaculia bacterium]|jgi:hypothetical protein
MSRSKSLRFSSGALVLTLTVPVGAAARSIRPVTEQTKIDFLLGEVRSSKAKFLRNGKANGGDRAASHLAWKLRFAGRRVQTVRQFIVGVASHSEETRMAYQVRWPDGRVQPLSEWLLERVDFYEKEHPERSIAAAPSRPVP